MLTDLRYRLRALFRRGQADADLDEELQFHLEAQVQSYLRRGLGPDEARRRACLDLGGLAQVKDGTRDVWGVRIIESLIHDVSYAFRTLRKTPAFTLTALLTLTIGVSFNTSLATMCMTMMYRPWPVPLGDELVQVIITRADNRGADIRSADYELLAGNATLSSVMATGCGSGGWLEECRFEIDDGPSSLGHFVSGNYFGVLEVPMERGRGLTEADDHPQAPAPVVVISHDLWAKRFNSTPDILGRTIHLDGIPFSVVGVAAASFTGTSLLRRHLWVSLANVRTLRPSTRTTVLGLELAARLRPGATPRQAQAELDSLLAAVEPRRITRLQPTSFYSRPNDRREANAFFAVAFSAVLLMLLVACANVGNLLLARTAARRREMAVRAAVGASRGRVVRQLLTESLVLAALASVIGLWVAQVVPELIFNAAFGSVVGGGHPAIAVGPDWRVVMFGIFLATVTCIAFGLTPAVQASRVEVLAELNGRGKGWGRTSLRGWLLGSQVAISVTLLGASGLLARGLERAYHVERGFQSAGTSQLSFELPASASIERRQAFEAAIIEASRDVADRGDIAIATASPFEGWINYVRLTEGDPKRAMWLPLTEVSSAYFSVLGIPLISGRTLSSADAGQHRMVVNEAFVRRIMRERNPVGVVFYAETEVPGGPRIAHEIVGVVGTVDHGEGAQPAVYEILGPRSEWLWSSDDNRQHAPRVLFKSAGAVLLTTPLVDAARRVEPRVHVVQAQLADVIAARFSDDHLSVWMAGSVGVLALLLATIGVSGAFAYAVQQQTREIGIRMAIGARTREVVLSIVRGGAQPLLAGLALGLAGTAIVGQLFRSSLYGLSPLDPISYVYVVAIVALAAFAALAMPAWRATRVNPITVLKAD